MKIDNLERLMVEELKDLYDAEKQLIKALPKMIKEAKSPRLTKALQDHLQQTSTQAQRLEQVFKEMGVTDIKKECKGMEALIAEGEEMLKQAANPITRDTALIAAAQGVEHYEMAKYGTLVTYANQLDRNSVADLLQKSLNEEKQADLTLSQIAEAEVNVKAL